ncbi:lipase family protein [Vibrio genomosp. F10]|uniref:lipase family protein n=2 Tax=Vibrio genomosp. F10 TaxID=723171 RepID=UPI0002F6B706|nr:lipase [Vibrio genomosp. F10]
MKTLKRYQYERYAVLCNLSYRRVLKQSNYGFSPKGQRIINNRLGQTFIRVLWHQDNEEVIIVIKGSHNLWDWLLTSSIWFKSCHCFGLPYSIHAGFHYLLSQESRPKYNHDSLGLSVFDRLFLIIKPLIQQGKRISITGHSSGGAIGCVIGDAIEKRFPKSIKRIVTFGQPAIGGHDFSHNYALQHKTYRVCCDLDIVTFLPPVPYFYQHVGKQLWLYNGKIYENTPTLLRLGRSITSWVLRPFTYHLMSKYIRNKDYFDER